MDRRTDGGVAAMPERAGAPETAEPDGTARPVTNVLSFDLEHWHSATLVDEHVTDPTDRIERSVSLVLDLLAAHDVTATFFTVGAVARDYPELIRRVAAAGHEVASHGETHTPLSALDRAAFATELGQSSEAIEAATGVTPRGFRAPNFSLSAETAWALDVLADHGYEYDASVFPVQTPMYGLSGAPVRPYRIHSKDLQEPVGERTDQSLVELPAAVFHPRLRVPVAGGFYGRLLPRWVLARGIRNLNARGIPATLYFHPWEFNPDVPVDGLPAHKRFVSFHGIEGLAGKLDWLLDRYSFDSAATAVTAATSAEDTGDHR